MLKGRLLQQPALFSFFFSFLPRQPAPLRGLAAGTNISMFL